MANEFNMSWEEDTFFKAEREPLGVLDLKLTLKVLHNNIKSWGPAEDIINDYSCVAGFVEDDASGAGKFLP